MNSILTANPTVAHQLIAERVRDAEQRRIARSVRLERRAARESRPRSASHGFSGWAFSFLHPAH